MIALSGHVGKGASCYAMLHLSHVMDPHKFVSRIITMPNFGQVGVKLPCETDTVASGPGLLSNTGFLSPPAPRGLELIGPDRFVQ
jgi:hypothetical protein